MVIKTLEEIFKYMALLASGCGAVWIMFNFIFMPHIEKFLDKYFDDRLQEEVITKLTSLNDELHGYIENHSDVTDTLQLGILNLTRREIHSAYKKFMSLGSIDARSLSVLEDLFDSYTKLGGNHFVAAEIDDLKHLPRIMEDGITTVLLQKDGTLQKIDTKKLGGVE